MQSLVKCDDVVIPMFDGSDYSHWKKRILKFLELKKCDEVVTRDRTNTDKEEEWKIKVIKAHNYIYSSITNKQFEFVSELDSPRAIMLKFDEMYLNKSTALQILHRNEIENIKLENFATADDFFNSFERGINNLKAAGASIKEDEKLNYMLKALPSSYSYIGDLIDVLPAKDRTCEYLKQKIRMKVASPENKLTASGSKSNVFMASRGRNSRGNFRGASSTQCYRCLEYGHFARECTSDSENHQGDQQQRRGRGNFRGNYRGRRGFQRGSSRGRGRAQNHNNSSSNNSSVFMANVSNIYNATKQSGDNEITWLLDSGCTDHIVNNDSYFSEYVDLKKYTEVKLGDGRTLLATKVGNVNAIFDVNGIKSEIIIKNVFYVKGMKSNLLSFSKITENNKIESIGNFCNIYNKSNNLVAVAQKENNLYVMKSSIKMKEIEINTLQHDIKKMTLKEKWHRTLGHVNFKSLNKLCKSNLVQNLPNELENNFMKCAICIENKMNNLPFENDRSRANELLELIHTDLNGPHRTVGSNGEKYFFTLTDDYSKIIKIFCIKSKDQVFDCLVEFVNEAENITNKRVKKLRCDNGTEYINHKIISFARKKGIRLNPCPTYVHELNGTAERLNRTIMDMARCLMAEAEIDRKFWPEAVKTSAYLKNRMLANTIERKTPYEIFFKKKPDAKYLRIFGSKVSVRIPDVKRDSKWDEKAEFGILVGYDEVGYRVLIDNKIIIARHVGVLEKDMMVICLDEPMESKDNQVTATADQSQSEEKTLTENQDDSENIDELEQTIIENPNASSTPRRSTREKKSTKDDQFVYRAIFVNYCNALNPETFEEALQLSDAHKWKKAMDSEFESLNANQTWKLVEKPKDKNKEIIELKWILRLKSDGRYKARLVAKGFQQKGDIDDTYSPVFKAQTLKILLSYSCQNGLYIEQMDVEAAFLNSKVTDEIYVYQPEGYSDGTDRVLRVLKALYGLKKSPRDWYECFHKFMTDLGFTRNRYDFCLYFRLIKNTAIYVLLFVDDLLICCKNMSVINVLKQKMFSRFKMKDLGKIKNYIGIEVNYNIESHMLLNQTKYIESLSEKFEITDAKLYSTPMEVNLKLEKTDSLNTSIKYRNLIGALLYISAATRPDIAFSVNYLSRFQNCYQETHYKYALRVLKYLYYTKNLNMRYTKKKDKYNLLDCYVDSDWAGDINDRKSTSGYVIRLYENPIFWKSRKQTTVTKSSTAAEYVALSEATSEIILIKAILKTFDMNLNEPVKIFEDNSGAVAIAHKGNFTKNAKYIETNYHYVHDYQVANVINVIKIESQENAADILTKSLNRLQFNKLREMLNLK